MDEGAARHQRATHKPVLAAGGRQRDTCYRCLKQGHWAHKCQGRLVCHSCGDAGHHQWECPRGHRRDGGKKNPNANKQNQAVISPQATPKVELTHKTDQHRVFMGCIIGEPIRRDNHGLPTLEEMRRGLWQKIPAMNTAKLWYLEAGMHFLRAVSMAAYIEAIG